MTKPFLCAWRDVGKLTEGRFGLELPVQELQTERVNSEITRKKPKNLKSFIFLVTDLFRKDYTCRTIVKCTKKEKIHVCLRNIYIYFFFHKKNKSKPVVPKASV